MANKIESLKLLIEAQEKQRVRGNLTEVGLGYLNGLKCAYALVSGDEQ